MKNGSGLAATAVSWGRKLVKAVPGSRPSGWPASARQDPHRWRAVTVNLSPDRVEIPAPLRDLGDAVEIRTRPAPGDKGTEIHARLTGDRSDGIDGKDALETLRQALRESKQLLEFGWIHHANVNRTSEPTVLNAPLREATEHAEGSGRL